MNQGLIPKRYAKALYEVAAKEGVQKELYSNMLHICDAFAAEPGMNATMNNPFVSDSDKKALILTAAGASDKDKDISNFLKLLADNRRLGMVRDIAAAYLKLYREANNIYKVEVVSAAPMEAAEEERLKKLILSHLNGGSIEYTSRIDPDLIGGFMVNIDNQRLDASVQNELKQLRLKLLSKK